MRLAERQRIAAVKAKAIMPPFIYKVIAAAIVAGASVNLIYTDRFGVKKKYFNEHPLSFFETPQDADWPGSVLLWSRHELHSKKEQYLVERITGVQKVITLIEALLDPSGKADFWSGAAQVWAEAVE